MPTWLLAFILGIGAAVYIYNFLAKHNGNANPKGNMMIGAGAGLIVFLVILSLANLILNFE